MTPPDEDGSADLFVHPTLYEGSSLVTLEAKPNFRSLGKKFGVHPVLVAADSTGAVLGWASLNRFNPRPAYDHVGLGVIHRSSTSRQCTCRVAGARPGGA